MVIKTAVTALSRKILKAKRELNKAKEQAEKNATAGRVARVKKKKDNLAELQKQTVAGQKIEKAAEDRKKESPEQISKRLREEKRIAGRKKRAAYRQGMKDKTPEDRKEIIKIRAEQKRDDIQDKLENLGTTYQYVTELGKSLLRKNYSLGEALNTASSDSKLNALGIQSAGLPGIEPVERTVDKLIMGDVLQIPDYNLDAAAGLFDVNERSMASLTAPYPETGFQAPDYNLMDRLSAAYQYLAPTSSADPSRQQEAAEVLFRESEASPEVREEALRIAPSAVLDAIRNRDISRLPTYEPIIPAFAGGSISIPEELPSNIPFPESVENLTAAVTADPIVSAPPQEEVSEERVKVIKKKPKEKRTSVEEQVVVASEVKKALDNASKGKKVKNELKAIVELAKVDPTIVKRYTTPGSQALQDITAQVDSFSFMPTIQKKKKTVDPWAFEDRRGGRR